ncbi:hypothetical protein B0O80DRAFT_46358 [Mortierella sp. GBAus27b]|nr:hypothetical protein B0O80DRAFT_46358 [Mortierella sp. GBAus27b]
MPQTSSSKFRASAADKQRHPSLERRCEDEQGESSQHLQPTHPSTQDPPRATGPVLRPTDLSRVNMRRHRTMDTTKNSDHLQHQHHEVPSEEHGLYDRRNEQDFNNSIEQENIQHSPRPAQDQQNESSELGWTIYEDPPDDPQPTSKTDRAFAEHKNHIRDPCESIATTSSSVPTMDARQQLLQRGKSMTQQRKQAQNQLSQTQQVQLELQEREKQMELEREDLDRRLKEQEQRRLEYESLREKLRIQQMKEAEGERQARAQDMSPRKRRRSEEDETGDGMARTRVDPHHSRQPQATNRPAQRRTHAPTRPQQQHHPQERVHVPAHQEHPQGEASESPRKRPREAEDEVSEEKVSRVRVDPHADDRVSSVAASSSNQPRQQHQHMQQRSETRPLQARRLPDQHAKQHHQAQSQREEPQRQVHPQASRQASQQASQQPPQQAVQQREPTAQELEELRKKRYRGFYAKCEKYYIYGEIYRDTTYEFRQVTLPKQMLRDIQPEFKLHPSTHLQTLKLLTV